ncbi:IS3 family transposase [Salmonella enterica subsp. enterica serovar Kentucky]|nr:IS3 family transposase [Salmonella enterica subsp. enterica serovar Kentucky]
MQSRTVYHWQSRRDDRAITLRIHIQLRREGWPVNHKKTHRIYCPEGLNLRRKRPADMSVQHAVSSARS